MNIHPIILTGRYVRLEPLSEAHLSDLAEVGLEESIWRYMRYGSIRTKAQLHEWIQLMLELQSAGNDLPFAVIYLEHGKAVGATRYLEIHHRDRGLEIGGTWYGLAYQRTVVNTESKYLLLKHAFEELSCLRVQFKADLRNERSQHAIERLGAVKEGILRDHMITPQGYIRSSVYYSILASEWPGVRQWLESLLNYPTEA